MRQLHAQDLSAWLADDTRARPVLVDVREPWEYQLCHIGESLHMPMSSVPSRLSELDEEADTVLVCHHGTRSFQVGLFLEQHGFKHVYNLHGGVDAWARSVEPGMPLY